MKKTKRPALLLAFPIMVWALTFAFVTGLFFILNGAHSNDYNIYSAFTSLQIVTGINITVLVVMFFVSFYHRQHQEELLRRIGLLLINLPVALLYLILLCLSNRS